MELATRLIGLLGLIALAAAVLAALYIAVAYWWLVIAIALGVSLARVLAIGQIAR
jgi:hypothetical protein